MEKIKFPWIEDQNEVPTKEPTPIPEARLGRVYNLIKPYLPYILFIMILGLISLNRRSNVSHPGLLQSRPPKSFAVVMSLVPIPKGTSIPPEALDIVEVPTASLTKTQKLRAFTPDQLNKLTQRIVAKRDIPSQVPIFWNDLRLSQEKTTSRSKRKTEILF